jgi:hypothetical protein
MTTVTSALVDLKAGEPTDLTDMALYDLAALIEADWRKKDGTPNVRIGAEPYLDAMAALDSIDDNYGYDSGRTICIYFVSNAAQWRGPVARAVKAELKRRYS